MAHDWTAVAAIGDISEETQTHRTQFQGQAVCLYRVGQHVYATQDRCTHGNASLADGWVDNCTIECPLHQGVFDIASGKPIEGPVSEPLRVFDVRVEGGTVYLKSRAG